MKFNTLFFLFLIIMLGSCFESKVQKINYSDNCAKPTVMDPNEVKPMALMMRTMADYCDTMRIEINNNIAVDSVKFPLMPFWKAEPTDSSVLEHLFFSNATNFENAYRKLMQQKLNQKENYTAVINECKNCHMSYCSGPLKRINKLVLDYKSQ